MWIYASDWLLSKVTLCLLLNIKDFAQKKKKKKGKGVLCRPFYFYFYFYFYREKRGGGIRSDRGKKEKRKFIIKF